ncbi:MAG: LapA family protein [Candidatus Eutrophobiaceae bacterium]
MRLIKAVALFATLILGLLLYFRNNDIVVLDLLFGTVSMPILVLILLATLFGALLGAVPCFLHILQQRRINQNLERQREVLKQEINKLRIPSLKSSF